MKLHRTSTLALAALTAVSALFAPAASAATVLTSYDSGDLFIGFRKEGESSTLVANLGNVSKFLPSDLGGTWDGNPFQVSFGVVPGTSNLVNNIGADLIATFGSEWFINATDGSSLRWAVVGFTDFLEDNTPINGYGSRTVFVTRPRVSPDVAATLGNVSRNNFATAFSAFAYSVSASSYENQLSTENSSVVFIGASTASENWNSRIGANGTFGLGSGHVVEQLGSGPFQGPTNSVLDLFVAPNPDSSIISTRTATGGSFVLNSSGELTYLAVPEPGSAAFLGLGVAFLGFIRRRNHTATSIR